MYLDYDSPRGKRGMDSGRLIGILVVVILAVAVGIGVYHMTKNYLDGLSSVPTATPTPVSALVTPRQREL